MSRKLNKRRIAVVITAVFCIVVFTILLFWARNPSFFNDFTAVDTAFDETQDFVKFMDVSQGDSILIYSNGYSALIDMGMSTAADEICDDLKECNISQIDMLIISHYHADHIGGFEDLYSDFKVKNMIGPKVKSDNIKAANYAKQTVLENGGNFYEAVYGLNFELGEFKITILGYTDSKNENNRSVYVMAEIDGIKFLFTGDGEIAAESQLLKRHPDIDCDILKVAHHGSKTSSGYEFLKYSTPQYAVISVGEGNSYGHPDSETLTALKVARAMVYRTDINGDISFYIDGNEIEIKTEKTGDYY